MKHLITEKGKDRIATAVIRGGGILVILVVLAIVLNIGLEALPLFLPASAGALETVADNASPLAVGSDPRREFVWALGGDGVLTFPGAPEREPLEIAPGPLVDTDQEIHGLLVVLDAHQTLHTGEVRFRPFQPASHGGRPRQTETATATWRPSCGARPIDL